MTQRIPLFLAVILAGMLWPSSARAQAAVGYGMAASKSASVTTRSAPAFTARAKEAAKRIQTRVAKPLPEVMKENKLKLEEESKGGGGKIHIDSSPEKATVAVDGKPVAYAPADLTLPEGAHNLELTHPDCLPWRLEVTVRRGESTELKAQMENRYKSSIKISIQQ